MLCTRSFHHPSDQRFKKPRFARPTILELKFNCQFIGQPQYNELVFCQANRTRVPLFFVDTLRAKQSENYLTTYRLFLKTNRVCATWLSNDVSQTLTASEPNCFSFVFILHLSFAVFFEQRREWVKTESCGISGIQMIVFLRASFMAKLTLGVKTVMVKRIKTSNFTLCTCWAHCA